MPLSLFLSLGLVATPAFLIAVLTRADGSRTRNAVCFAAAFLLFAPLILGLRKLIMAPEALPDMQHYLRGSIEQIGLVGLLFACGLPGLLWRRAPRAGFFFAYLILGAALTFLLTFGNIAERGLRTGLPEIFAYVGIAVFLFFWSRRGNRNDHRLPETRRNAMRRVEPPLRR